MSLFGQLYVWWNMRRAGRSIRRFGVHAVYVGDYSRDPPAWVYSVGFDEQFDYPEVVAFDMPQPTAARFVAYTYDEVKAGRLVIEDGATADGAETRCVWRKVHPDQLAEWLPLALWRRYAKTGKRVGLEAYQLVLSDPDGLMPWEPGYDERLRPLQPALWEPLDGETGAHRTDGGRRWERS